MVEREGRFLIGADPVNLREPRWRTCRLNLSNMICADEPARVSVSADQRNLGDDALHAPIDRADHEHVPTAVT